MGTERHQCHRSRVLISMVSRDVRRSAVLHLSHRDGCPRPVLSKKASEHLSPATCDTNSVHLPADGLHYCRHLCISDKLTLASLFADET